jgi:ATP-dependent helicase Lhr and Lhr-like helicase
LIRRQSGALEWWNFAGQLFNAALAGRFRGLGLEASYDHFAVTVHGNADVASIRSAIEHLVADTSTTLEIPVAKTIWPELKFAACVPDHLLTRMFASRMDQSSVIEMIQGQGMRVAPIP